MIAWLTEQLSKLLPKGVGSRRFSIIVGSVVLLAWLWSFAFSLPLPELPATILLFLIIIVGSDLYRA